MSKPTIAGYAILAVGGISLGALTWKIVSGIKNFWRFWCLRNVYTLDKSTYGADWAIFECLFEDIDELPVLGFGCQWVSDGGTRRPVAMLQLSSASGFCALIRLCELRQIPNPLKFLLECSFILKVGVAPVIAAEYLWRDFGLQMMGTVDLRHLAKYRERPPEGLATMASSFLGIELDKTILVRHSSWDCKTLHIEEIEYAATECRTTLEIYKAIARLYGTSGGRGGNIQGEFHKIASEFADKPFECPGAKNKYP